MELVAMYEEQGFSYEVASEKAYYEEMEVLKQQADIKRKEQRENEIHKKRRLVIYFSCTRWIIFSSEGHCVLGVGNMSNATFYSVLCLLFIGAFMWQVWLL